MLLRGAEAANSSLTRDRLQLVKILSHKIAKEKRHAKAILPMSTSSRSASIPTPISHGIPYVVNMIFKAFPRLVLIQVDAKDCRDCERSTWVSRNAGGVLGNGTQSVDIAPFKHKIFPGPKSGSVFRQFRHVNTQMAVLPYHPC